MRQGAGHPVYPVCMEGLVADCKGFETVIPFGEITVPTLIVHGDHDADIPYAMAQQAANGIPGAELYTVQGGWHILCFHPNWKQTYQKEIDFAKKHLGV